MSHKCLRVEILCENIRVLIFGTDKNYLKCTVLNIFAHKVVAGVIVLRPASELSLKIGSKRGIKMVVILVGPQQARIDMIYGHVYYIT